MQAIERVLERIESAKQDRDVWRGAIPVGKHIRQGDVMILGVKMHIRGLKVLASGERAVQIAVGQGIGSRHIIEAAAGVTVYAPEDAGPLDGPVLFVADGCEGLLTHPEHRHFVIPAGTYRVVYQRDFMAEEVARVQD